MPQTTGTHGTSTAHPRRIARDMHRQLFPPQLVNAFWAQERLNAPSGNHLRPAPEEPPVRGTADASGTARRCGPARRFAAWQACDWRGPKVAGGGPVCRHAGPWRRSCGGATSPSAGHLLFSGRQTLICVPFSLALASTPPRCSAPRAPPSAYLYSPRHSRKAIPQRREGPYTPPISHAPKPRPLLSPATPLTLTANHTRCVLFQAFRYLARMAAASAMGSGTSVLSI